MDITNERDKPFGIHCGGPKRKDATVDVTGKYVRLQFHSDADLQKRGFLLYFSTVPLPSKYKQLKTVHVSFPRGLKDNIVWWFQCFSGFHGLKLRNVILFFCCCCFLFFVFFFFHKNRGMIFNADRNLCHCH